MADIEWLDNNDILIYPTQNEGKSVIAEKFIKTLKAKIYKKITANDSKSYLPYLNKLIDEYNKTSHHSINKRHINADYSAFTEKSETNSKTPKFKVNDIVRITKYQNMFSKACDRTKCLFLNDESSMVRPTLIDINPD